MFYQSIKVIILSGDNTDQLLGMCQAKYRISGNIDSDFNLADRFSVVKLKFAITLFKFFIY